MASPSYRLLLQPSLNTQCLHFENNRIIIGVGVDIVGALQFWSNDFRELTQQGGHNWQCDNMEDPSITGNNSASKYDANSGGSGAIYGNALFERGVQYTTSNDRTVSTQTLIGTAYFNISPEESKARITKDPPDYDEVPQPLPNTRYKSRAPEKLEKQKGEDLDVLWKLYKKERKDMTAKHGPNHPYTLGVQYQIAEIYEKKGNFKRAIIVYKYVFDISEEHRGDRDPLSIKASEGLGRCYRAQGNHTKASKWALKLSLGDDK